jgi:hypothetical protein
MADRSLELLEELDHLQERVDALKRKCSTGYGCGSACISLRKECRTSPGSTLGKERLKRLLALAAGEIKPRGIGVPKAGEAAAMAERLQASRATRAAELLSQRKANAHKNVVATTNGKPGISQSLLRQINASDVKLGIQQNTRSQKLVYEERGYNAKPEIVGTRKELSERSDLIQGARGRTMVLCRGVTNDDSKSTNYIEDFKRGATHYVGGGMHGNGTYAASGIDAHVMAFEYSDLHSYGYAQEKHGPALNREANKCVMAFGIKKSASIVECSTVEEFGRFEKETIRMATQALRRAGNTTGVVNDLGLAAAIVGIDAYSLPAPKHYRNKSRYWVVLNRGAVVVADDGQWT